MFRIFFFIFLISSNSLAAQQRSDDRMLCAAMYLVVNSIIEDPGASEMIGKLQESFETLYRETQTKSVTNGDIGRLKHEHAIYLGNLYDRNSDDVVRIEMNCDTWRQSLIPYWQGLYNEMKGLSDNNASRKKIRKMLKKFPRMPNKKYNRSDQRWEESEYMVMLSFETWTENGRRTPYSIKQEIYKELGTSNN